MNWTPINGIEGDSTFYSNNIAYNNDKDTIRFQNDENVRYVKVKPLTWNSHISMRCGVSYTPISVAITDANINTIVGDGSVIMDLINKLELRLVTDGKVPSAPVSALTLAATQWATSGLLGSYIDDALNVTQSPLILPLGV